MNRSSANGRRLGKAEVLAVALIVGSAFIYWHRAGSEPGIVFHDAAAERKSMIERGD
ncbi:MAG: hypothetical protein AAGB48_00550 [Planctomycetota bacterium]